MEIGDRGQRKEERGKYTESKDKVTYRVDFRLRFEKDGLEACTALSEAASHRIWIVIWMSWALVEGPCSRRRPLFGTGLGCAVRFRTRRWWQWYFRGEGALLGGGCEERSGRVRMLEVRNRKSGVENELRCGVVSRLAVGVGVGVVEELVLGERVRTSLSS